MKAGDQIGIYVVEQKVGDGGMGEVFKAVDQNLGRAVALKCLRAELAGNEAVLERFRTEARLLARLEHPNIASVYTLLGEGHQITLVMEFVGGGSLDGLLRQRGRLPADDAARYVLQILDGVGYAHAAGVVHRDLKPSNAMLSEAGLVKLVDFGIARAIGSARLTRSGHLVGTLEYMAPEQVKGAEGDARSDLYSVGIILFELLTGRPPFQSQTDYELIREQVETPPPRLADSGAQVGPELEAVVRRALAKDPAERFPDAQAFAEALREAVPEAAYAPSPQTVVIPRRSALALGVVLQGYAAPLLEAFRGERGIRVVLGVLVAIVLAEGFYLAFGGAGEPPRSEASEVVRELEEGASPAPERSRRITGPIESESGARELPPIEPTKRDPIAVGPEPDAPPKKLVPPKQPKQKPKQGTSRVTARIRDIDVHASVRRGGMMARPAGYSAQVDITGGGRIDEVYEVWSGGSRVLREVVLSKVRKAGRFSTRRRVAATQKLNPGRYDVRLRFESGGRLLAQHKWKLTVR